MESCSRKDVSDLRANHIFTRAVLDNIPLAVVAACASAEAPRQDRRVKLRALWSLRTEIM